MTLHAPRVFAALVLLAAGRLAAQAPVAVRGTVTAAERGVPLANARVAVEGPARGGGAPARRGGGGARGGGAGTPADGGYVLRDLPTGHYEVLVTALGYEPVRRDVAVVRG